MRAKYIKVAKSLESRIKHGDYLMSAIPGERKIAEEHMVSYMTARKAMKYLISNGVLERQPDGKSTAVALDNNRNSEFSGSFAFVTPAYASLLTQRWHIALEKYLTKRGCRLRPIHFVHWDDIVLSEGLQNFDGIFLLPTLDPVPDMVIERFTKCGAPVVILERDWSEKSFVSIISQPLAHIGKLLEHIASLNKKRIDCFNTQPLDHVIESRIDFWNSWMKEKHLSGKFINSPVESYGNSLEKAYEYSAKAFKDGNWNTDAVFCTTLSSAIGLMRAMMDCDLKPGVDIAVCSVNGEGWSQYMNPRLTTLTTPAIEPFIEKCFNWMKQGKDAVWKNDLCLQPSKLDIYIGESTTGKRIM